MIKIITNLVKQYVILIRYFFIGASSAVLDLAIFFVLFNEMEWSSVSATALSVAIATVYAFTLNALFNFKIKDNFLGRLVSYSLVSILGMFISMLLLYFFSDMWGYSGNIVKIASLPIIFLVQYLLNKHVTFKEKEAEESGDVKAFESKAKNAPKTYAVIGGGFTGLAAAYDLVKAGHNVTIFEFNDHLGGLAASFDLNGYPVERAYHFLYQSDEDILSLAEELGIRDKITFHPSGIRYFHEGTDYPFNTPLDLIRFTPLSFLNRIRLGVLTLYLKNVKKWRPLSRITAWDWLNKWMGTQVTKEVWEPLLRGKFNRYFDQITMSWLWGRFNIRARSQNKDFSGEKLGYPEGSFAIIVDAIIGRFKAANVNIKLNTGIKRITKLASGSIEVETLQQETHIFDGVVATVPSPIFAHMIQRNNEIDQEYIDRLNSVEYLDAVVMVFRTKQRLTDTFWYNIKDERVTFLTLLSTSALAGNEQFGGSEVYYVGAYVPREHAYMQPEHDIEGEWKAGLSVMFPDFDESQIQDLKISKFKDAQHIVDIGYEEKKLMPFATPIEGLYLANFSQIYPDDRGTNFAIRDGRRVAKELMGEVS